MKNSEQKSLFPSGLTKAQSNLLLNAVNQGEQLSIQDLHGRVVKHYDDLVESRKSNRLINIRLAKAIVEVVEGFVRDRDSFSSHSQKWMAGAMYYFSTSDDDEPDFISPIGFEDDTEVLNACLRFVGLGHECLAVEDFDDA